MLDNQGFSRNVATVVAKVVATICKCLVIKHLIFSRKVTKGVDFGAWCLYAISTMKFVNLTPHDITVIMGDQADRKTFAKSGDLVRDTAGVVIGCRGFFC